MKKEHISLIGFYSSATAFVAVAGFGVVQVLQVINMIVYPLSDVLIYSFSLAIALPFLFTMLALHYCTPEEQQFWSFAAILLAQMYAIYVILMYTVQLATVIPLSLHDPTDNVLTVKPHSVFWTIDALGYICMGLSTFFAALIFKKNGPESLLRKFLLANAMIIPVISIVYFYPHFSVKLLLLGFPWLITTAGALLLFARYFKVRVKAERSLTVF